MTPSSLDFIFNPRSIALAGVSADASKPGPAQWYLMSLIKFGYPGKIYPLHPAGGEINGLNVYKKLEEIPGEVDYVVSAVSARHTPQLIRDCAAKGVRAAHLFTSGYSEIEDSSGKQLEKEVLQIAREGSVRLIGPNCMGIYCPSGGMTFAGDYPDQSGFPTQPGPFALISQSGGNCIYCIREASERGLFFSKAISYGNAADLNECDFLEYVTDDPATEIIAMYIEGIKDGERFKRALRRAAAAKPVVIYKAGNTETGARACASHTSAIAGSAAVWQALFNQLGIIQVNGMSELVDISITLAFMKPPQGRNVVVAGSGGGVGVQAADDFTGAGLHMPFLHVDLRRELHGIYGSEAGSMFRNPLDIPPLGSVDHHLMALRTVADSKDVDVVIMQFPLDLWALSRRTVLMERFIEVVTALRESISKPLAVVLHYSITSQARRLEEDARARFAALQLPVYPSFSRAARALDRFIRYHDRHNCV
ncbi:MAG: CoA-binding protein [Dehalococcoidia bacterium]